MWTIRFWWKLSYKYLEFYLFFTLFCISWIYLKSKIKLKKFSNSRKFKNEWKLFQDKLYELSSYQNNKHESYVILPIQENLQKNIYFNLNLFSRRRKIPFFKNVPSWKLRWNLEWAWIFTFSIFHLWNSTKENHFSFFFY